MSDKEITLKVGSEFDGKGTADAKKALDGLGPAAQGAAGKSLQGFGKVKEGLTSVSQGVRTLNQLVAGFGFIGALTKVASFASDITQHFKDIEEARRNLQEGLDKIAKDSAEGFSGKVVSELADALKRANDELDRAAARQKAQTNARRTEEDAADSLEEAEELAAILPEDPLAAQKAGEIRARHAAARGTRAARRKVEDIQTDIAGMGTKRTQLLDASHTDNEISHMNAREAEALRKAAIDKRYEGEKLVIATGGWSAAILDDGTVTAWGDDSQGAVTALNALPRAERVIPAANGAAAFAILASGGGWREAIASAPLDALGSVPSVFSPDMRRDLILRRFVDAAVPEGPGTAILPSGAYRLQVSASPGADAPRMSMAVIGLRWHWRQTVAQPNRLHISIPPLSAPGKIYSRVCLLKDNGPAPRNPFADPAAWQAIWNGGAPAGHTQIASQFFVHTRAVSSVMLPLDAPGAEGTAWLIILPVHAPLDGDALSWDIEQDGWDESKIFFFRE